MRADFQESVVISVKDRREAVFTDSLYRDHEHMTFNVPWPYRSHRNYRLAAAIGQK